MKGGFQPSDELRGRRRYAALLGGCVWSPGSHNAFDAATRGRAVAYAADLMRTQLHVQGGSEEDSWHWREHLGHRRTSVGGRREAKDGPPNLASDVWASRNCFFSPPNEIIIINYVQQ